MQFKAVIFDLDGTLLNTLEDIADSANFVLRQFGFPEHDLKTYQYFLGEGMEKLIRKALPKDKTDEKLIAKCVSLMRKEYQRRWADKTYIYPEVPRILDFLTQHQIRMAILSNKPDDFTRRMVAKFLSLWKFDLIQGEKASRPQKPDPAAALLIAQKLGISPLEFLFIGDSEVDMKTAVAAEMFPVGVLWGFRTEGELIASGAKALIKNGDDFFTLFSS
jgi:phosphoglycolate phosphatase